MVDNKQNPLFSLSDIESVEPVKRFTKVSRSRTEKLNALGKTNSRVAEVIGSLEMGVSLHYVSMGEWSTHDLLFHILKQTGPADVTFATWSFNEIAIRKMVDALKDGTIRSLKAILDWRIKVRRPKVYELVHFNVTDIRLTSCHAKVTVIANADWQIAIVGSANYTNNPRIEAGVIVCDPGIAQFHKEWMHQELQRAKPFGS